MCDPVIAPILISAAASGYSAYSQQEAQNKANKYQANIADRNAAIAEEQAKDAESRGIKDVQNLGKQVRQVIGDQKVAFANANVAVDKGSAKGLTDQTQAMGDEDAMTLKANTAKEARGLRMQAQNASEEARMRRSAITDPWQAGGLSLLAQGTALASRYIK